MDSTPRILVLDDLISVRWEIEEISKKTDFNKAFTFATCPVEGMKMIKDYAFDLLVCDYSMPIFNGDTVLSVLGELGREDLPVVAFSGDNSYNDRLSKFSNVIASFEKDYRALMGFLEERFKQITPVQNTIDNETYSAAELRQ